MTGQTFEQTNVLTSIGDVSMSKQDMKKPFRFGPKIGQLLRCIDWIDMRKFSKRSKPQGRKKPQIPIHKQTAKISFLLYSYYRRALVEYSSKLRQYGDPEFTSS